MATRIVPTEAACDRFFEAATRAGNARALLDLARRVDSARTYVDQITTAKRTRSHVDIERYRDLLPTSPLDWTDYESHGLYLLLREVSDTMTEIEAAGMALLRPPADQKEMERQ